MIIYGYAKEYKYSGDGTLWVKTRIPSIHGPYNEKEAKGVSLRSYTRDVDLPWYQSLLLPHLPNEGEVVALTSIDSAVNDLLIIGLTGASYQTGLIINGGVV